MNVQSNHLRDRPSPAGEGWLAAGETGCGGDPVRLSQKFDYPTGSPPHPPRVARHPLQAREGFPLRRPDCTFNREVARQCAHCFATTLRCFTPLNSDLSFFFLACIHESPESGFGFGVFILFTASLHTPSEVPQLPEAGRRFPGGVGCSRGGHNPRR